MVLFNLKANKVQPLRRINTFAGLIERDIEDLVWENLSEVCGEPLFPVKRQASAGGGVPDILALDPDGRIVVIEIKRGVHRGQLSQILEYAGWASTATFDEISGLYHQGSKFFWDDWQNFTNTESRVQINRDPRLFMIAEDYDFRTRKAIDFLASKKINVSVITVSLYEDSNSGRYLDVQGIKEPEQHVDSMDYETGYDHRSAWRISIKELLDAGKLQVGDQLVWIRPKLNLRYTATVLLNGNIQLEDGRTFYSPSGAAAAAADIVSANGWATWTVPRVGVGVTLSEIQQSLGYERFLDTSGD